MPIQQKALGQLRPADTNAATLYRLPSAGTDGLGRAVIRSLWVCNTTGLAATCRIFLDMDGTVYDEASALVYDKSIAANDSLILTGLELVLDDPNGGVGVRSGTANALTFTLFGEEENFF